MKPTPKTPIEKRNLYLNPMKIPHFFLGNLLFFFLFSGFRKKYVLPCHSFYLVKQNGGIAVQVRHTFQDYICFPRIRLQRVHPEGRYHLYFPEEKKENCDLSKLWKKNKPYQRIL